MTCVVCVVDTNGKREMVMAADTALDDTDSHTRMEYEGKVWRVGGTLFGFAGNAAALQIIRTMTIPPAQSEIDHPVFPSISMPAAVLSSEHLFRSVAFPLSNEIIAHSARKVHDDWCLLIAHNGRMWYVENGLVVERHPQRMRKWFAIGAGAPYALGALHVMAEEECPEDTAWQAVSAALSEAPTVVGRGYIALRVTPDDTAQ